MCNLVLCASLAFSCLAKRWLMFAYRKSSIKRPVRLFNFQDFYGAFIYGSPLRHRSRPFWFRQFTMYDSNLETRTSLLFSVAALETPTEKTSEAGSPGYYGSESKQTRFYIWMNYPSGYYPYHFTCEDCYCGHGIKHVK